ncbi:putative RNA-directed DNA polymerase [Helianthus annuus]|uniref:RNA-directed DNA polymerase n=1 Tax=Helianthus annuus TaxID=4232 RepID=A0A9K3HBW9_HELAN|nr:putative RNA-directed DNA polymerase [Helianthus annuus]
MNQEFVKLDRFDGQNYTRWADKVKFMLVVLKLYYILDPDLPAIPDDPPGEAGELPNEDLARQRLIRKEAEDLCLGHIKNSLSDRLYDLYAPIKSARELWKALEDKYKAHEEGTNKYLIAKYLDFQMVDDKSILEQVHELQVLVNKLTALSIPLPEIFQVGVIIAKLPPGWKDFSKRMMHKSEDYSLDELLKHLRIEEETRNRDKRGKVGSSVNHVAGGSGQKGKGASSRNKKFTAPKKKEFKKSQHTNNHQPKRSGKCHVCGETGHYARECSQRKSGSTVGSTSAIDVEKVTNLVANVGLGEVNMLSQYTRIVACRGWFLDSGATVHVCGNRGSFLTYAPVPQGTVVVCADGHRVEVRGKGTVRLNFRDGQVVTLQDVLHVPGITKGLVSADKFDRNGYKLVIKNLRVKFSLNDIYVGQAKNTGGMYRLDLAEDGIGEEEDSDQGGVSVIDGFGNESDSDSGGSVSSSIGECNAIGFDLNEIMSSDYIACSISLWHKRLAHTNIKNIEKMQTKGLLKLNDKDFEKCETCVKSKFTKKPFPSVPKRNTSLLELIHSDICELNGVLTRGGKRYFITFCDDSSRYLYVYLLHSKDEAFEAFKIYKAEVEKQKEKRIKILRSDRGGEYFNRRFDAFCEEEGIIHERTAPYTPQQNGLAERKNRTLVEMANCMLNQSGLPRNMWGEAVLTACYVHNRITSRVIPTSPYELWKGRKPNLEHLRVWGCLAYYRVPDPKTLKLGERAFKSVFIGYASHSKSYRLLDDESGIVVESRDVEFFENKFSRDDENSNGTTTSSTSEKRVQPSPIVEEPRKSTRVRKEKSYGDDFFSYLVEGTQKKVMREVIFAVNLDDDPKTFNEAMSSRDAPLWKEAVNDEMDSIMGNGTWELADLPKGKKPIGSKWIFKRKYHPDGSISAYKARLVAKGYRQREGVDYFDTYAPVARIGSIRTLIAVSALKGLYIHQMDVKTAFLNGYLNEEIYLEQPEGFVMPGQENKVCRLIKSLYGLKQAPKQWHERFDTTVTAFGFRHNSADRCIYTKCEPGYTVVICLYVDDMLIISTHLEGISETKKYLSLNFKMKDLGEVDTILGIKVKRAGSQISLSQSHYIEKILTKFQHLNIKEFNTPFDPSVKLNVNSGRAVAQLEYASAIGSMMYATHCTRPDIAFAVSKLSQYTVNPGTEHWKAVGRVLGYLKRTSNLELTYTSSSRILEGYSDASWIDRTNDSKSTSGWIFTLAGGAVSWASKKQTCIAHSTMEAELIALAAAGKEAEWIRDLLTDIRLWDVPMPCIPMYCDSEATLSKVYNAVYNGGSRHIGLRHNYVRQLLESGTIKVVYVKTSKNLADPFTKPLTRDLVVNTARDMGLKPQ